MRRAPWRGVLAQREFRLVLAAQATSAIGSSLVPVALAFAVFDLTGSAVDLGLVLGAGVATRLALLLVAGVWADRLPRQRVMLAADLLRCGTQSAMAVLLLTGSARLWALALLVIVYGAGDAFFSPAATALLPQVVTREHLQDANALVSLARNVCWALGPAIAGLLVQGAGPGWVFAVDAATFAASALALSRIRSRGLGTRTGPARFLADLRDGWREVYGRPWLRASIAYFSMTNLAMAPFFVLGPLVSERSLDGAESWGLIGSCAAAGSLLGDLIALRVHPRRPLATGYFVSASAAVAPLLLAVPASALAIGAAAGLGFAALGFSNAMWFTALQQHVPAYALSRVSSYDWMGSFVFQPLGFVLAGPVAAGIGVPQTLALAAGVRLAATVCVLLVPGVRQLGADETAIEPPMDQLAHQQ
jgi:MFS family permease